MLVKTTQKRKMLKTQNDDLAFKIYNKELKILNIIKYLGL